MVNLLEILKTRKKSFFSFFKRKKKIGLALGGGGSKGFAHFPIISGMIKDGVRFDYVSGSSIGAIVGAYLCLNGEVDSFFEEVSGLKYKDWFSMFDFTYSKNKSVIKGEKFREYLKGFFGNKTFDDLKIPLVVTVVNLDTGELEYISSGKLIDAVMASSSYPGVFPVCRIKKKNYIDGGFIDNLPFRILFDEGMDRVVAINLSRIYDEKFKVVDLDSKSEVLFRVEQIVKDYISNLRYSGLNNNSDLFIFEPNLKKSFHNTWNLLDKDDKVRVGSEEYERKKRDFLGWLG